MSPLFPEIPWVFLALCAVGALFTVNTLRPVRGGAVLIIPSFLQSWMTGELVAHQFALQLVATIAFVWGGALSEWPGWVGLGLTTISWGAMVARWRRGRRAEQTMETALADHVSSIEGPRVPSVKLWFPFWMSRPDVQRTRNVEYGRVGKKKLLLDVYAPVEPGHRRPAVLQIHGGGWVLGSKSEQGLPLLHHLAAHGWVGFNVDYRLSPRATFPDHLVDIKRALAWIRDHAEEYGVDPDFIVVTGGSAGGHLTAMMALTENDPQYQPGFESADTSVQGAVPFYAIFSFTDPLELYSRGFLATLIEPLVMKARLKDDPDAFRAASPLERIHAGAPPFLVVHGDRDTLAPVEYARLFVERLRERSTSPVAYAELEGAQHAFEIFHSPRTVRVIEGVERFVSELHRRYLAEREHPAESA